MSTATARKEAAHELSASPAGRWIVGLGYLCLLLPTIYRLAQQSWTKEIGAHGPIILATGAWLIWRQRSEMLSGPVKGSPLLTWLLLVPSLAAYIFGRTYGFLMLEAGGLYGAGVAILQALVGVRALLRNWFPLLYLGFAVPPPTWVIDALTLPLKQFVTYVSTEGLHAAGYPVAREGVTIFVAQYELLVEDACSGMHSLLGLVAITLLYVYLMRGSSWGLSLLYTAIAIPIAVVANILRIVVLVLLTYYFGNAVAQGFLHQTAGILLFGSALLLVFAVDQGLTWLMRQVKRKPA
jgi:exosortase